MILLLFSPHILGEGGAETSPETVNSYKYYASVTCPEFQVPTLLPCCPAQSRKKLKAEDILLSAGEICPPVHAHVGVVPHPMLPLLLYAESGLERPNTFRGVWD